MPKAAAKGCSRPKTPKKYKNRFVSVIESLPPTLFPLSCHPSNKMCDPTDLIWTEGTPFQVMTGRTALRWQEKCS